VLYEVTQIKEWLAENLGLRTEGEGGTLRIIDPVPDGEHIIPIGSSLTPFHVRIKDGRVYLGKPAGDTEAIHP
jgi:hypothetical protein